MNASNTIRNKPVRHDLGLQGHFGQLHKLQAGIQPEVQKYIANIGGLITSEVIQVPDDGNPIIMLADHGTVGGYPKIATVISADLDNLAQLTPNTEVSFKEVSIGEAEKIYKNYLKQINKYIEYLRYD